MPDKLRRDPEVLRITREFAASGRLVAAICHGGWIPISAKVYSGVKVTGSPGIKDDLINAGTLFEDASVVVDRHFVSSRKPDDLRFLPRNHSRMRPKSAEGCPHRPACSSRRLAAQTQGLESHHRFIFRRSHDLPEGS